METVLVTGAAGFIGSHTVEKLLTEGYGVVGIDAFTDNYPSSRKEANLKEVIKNENFTLIKKDLNALDLEKTLKGISAVFHLAAQTNARGGWGKDYDLYQKNNVLATKKLLDACKGKDIRKFIFASSSSVYGNAPYPTKEDNPLSPLSPYAKTKVEAENLCLKAQQEFSLPLTILRYFTVFGERQRPDMAIYIFIKSLFEKKDIKIFGNGEQRRDFTFISDTVNANIRALRSPETGIFNISGKNVVIINRVIEDLVKITGFHAELIFAEAQKGEPDHTGADISRAAEKLGYNPTVSLFKGLEKQIAWYCREVLHKEPPQNQYWKPY